jgi:hypothetical protein
VSLAGLSGSGTARLAVPVAALTENFSPRPLIAPPDLGSDTLGRPGWDELVLDGLDGVVARVESTAGPGWPRRRFDIPSRLAPQSMVGLPSKRWDTTDWSASRGRIGGSPADYVGFVDRQSAASPELNAEGEGAFRRVGGYIDGPGSALEVRLTRV